MSPSLEQRLKSDTSFERLYRRHRRDVYGAVLRDVRDPDEAEDVTQIAFLNALRAIRRGEEPDKPRAWLVTIARNVVRRRYQTLARRPQEVALDPDVAADLTDVNGPTAGEITAAIRRLPPNQRAVILLREIQGRSYAEIADELELSFPAVETLIFRARRSLSDELKLADHVPATQRRKRGVRGLLALPLPGFGKLSLGFSVGRAGFAAVLGGVAIATVPVTDTGAESPLAPVVQGAPSLTAETGPPLAPALGILRRGKTQAASIARPPGKKRRGETGAARQDTLTGAVAKVAGSLPLPLAGDNAPSSGVQPPPLPVESPTLPPLHVNTPTPPPLPVHTPTPPPLPVNPPALPPLPVEPPPLPPVPVDLPPLPT